MPQKLPQDTIDRIEKEAKELYPYERQHDKVADVYYDGNSAKRMAAVKFGLSEATRSIELVNALEEILAINSSIEDNGKMSYSQVGLIAKQALTNYKKQTP